MQTYLGIDVGTGSARAGLFDASGQLLAHHTRAIQMWRPQTDFVEQSSDDIWAAICTCVQTVMAASGVAPADVKGIGFDATCSLVALDADLQPVTVSPSGDDAQNVIVWMDHRALAETAEVNRLAEEHEVFQYVGGQISPEMQVPKLLWLQRHLASSWKRTAHFFDLPDFLTFRATGSFARSLCSTVCKWTYLGHKAESGESGWDREFFNAAGLGDLVAEDFTRIGTAVQPMGAPVGDGLSQQAASELGLVAGTPVGTSIIDAHAGGIGMLGMAIEQEEVSFDTRLALIGGTSSCHMAVSPDIRAIPGVWGPYFSAMVPGLWLNEGGQSATGALVDHVVFNHAATAEAQAAADAAGQSIYAYLNDRLTALADGQPMEELTRDLHVYPDFHGNRSPRADPTLKGMISGLSLSATVDDLARLYLATIQGIAYGTRHIIAEMIAAGYTIDTLICCGGGTKNPVFLQQHADATGCRLILPQEPEAVLLGAAMLGAVASQEVASLEAAMATMATPGKVITPNPHAKRRHDRKYDAFHQLHALQIALRTE